MHPLSCFFLALILLILLTLQWQLLQAQAWLWFQKTQTAPKTKTPRILKPKSENDCSACLSQKACAGIVPQAPKQPRPWSEVKNRRGRKKTIPTQGDACPNSDCNYDRVTDANVHALVGFGRHGKQEKIQDLRCQACSTKFTVRRNTVLYRLKTHSKAVALALAFLAEGMDVSALERVMAIGEGTLRTGLARSGQHAEKLHSLRFQNLSFAHIQLDELWANVRQSSQETWGWVATEATTKVIPVIRQGPRPLDLAMNVVHALVNTMQPGCRPVFTTDGLKLYFYALTAHFGHWTVSEDVHKPFWQVSADLRYAQVKKIQRRRRLVKVEHILLCGLPDTCKAALKAAGLSGRIHTAFVERIHLTIRQSVSFLARRTWSSAQFIPELETHLHWWRAYYHFSRYHPSLRIALATPIHRKGKLRPRRFRSRTPAMAAGLADFRWSV